MTMTAIDIQETTLVAGSRDAQSRRNHGPVLRRQFRARRQAPPTISDDRGVSDPAPVVDDLGRRLAAGDTEALREVYARYGGPMLTAALHHLDGDRRLAEDALQAALVKAWRAASTFDPTRPVAPWLYAIVRHCAIDIRRHERRHQRVSLHTVDDERISAGKDAFESATTAWAVRAALERLSATEHAVMRLTYFEGLTQGEIAARLGIPVGTVKTRAARAHDRLRGVLGDGLAAGPPPARRGWPRAGRRWPPPTRLRSDRPGVHDASAAPR
jgi:RNA polymerase sigma-70 factor (ECF subfamily)